ncbi:MAG: NTP transferase domain-containing protein [Cyclobacteriaceae bacterium]
MHDNFTKDLYGLILMGGQSSRMGTDKSSLEYHGQPHAEFMFELVKGILPDTFVSVREDQQVSFTDQTIQDNFSTKGPINGILSAMTLHPDKAWLVLAVDLPFVTEQTIHQLISSRNTSKMATALATKESGLPEPLVAIWEPNSAEALKEHHLVEDKRCPRKFLINSDIELVHPQDDLELYNANNPDEYKEAKSMIK